MIEYIQYSIKELNVEYVLPGKVQTDNLEKRFSCYRQLSGGNYHVTMTQILESEKKIRLKNMLGLKSARYGEIKFSFDNLEDWDDEIDGPKNATLNLETFREIIRSDYLETDIDESSVLSVAGYAAFKVQARIECNLCVSKVVSHEHTDDKLFNNLNRGGLTVPTKEILHLAKHVLGIATALISNDYEISFMGIRHKRKLVIALADEAVSQNDEPLKQFFTENCLCGEDMMKPYTRMLMTFTNIALNDYIKMKNDSFSVTAPTCKKRKVKTFDRVSTSIPSK